ncbi:MAG: cytochrome C oxidase subunit IV family protein, partial [Myxococcales bacterium]|nr:cytochrome C oxidase subunit IV family protein [Myxococcales bacterium]
MNTENHIHRSAHDDGGHGHDDGHHVLPLKVYFGVYGALLFLTVATVAVSFAGLGKLAIPVAMAVAVVKAGFVVGYFMHLKYDSRAYSLVFFSSILFVGIFFGITMTDLTTRDQTNREAGNFGFANEQTNLRERERATS